MIHVLSSNFSCFYISWRVGSYEQGSCWWNKIYGGKSIGCEGEITNITFYMNKTVERFLYAEYNCSFTKDWRVLTLFCVGGKCKDYWFGPIGTQCSGAKMKVTHFTSCFCIVFIVIRFCSHGDLGDGWGRNLMIYENLQSENDRERL